MGSEVDQKPLASDDEIFNGKSDLIYMYFSDLFLVITLYIYLPYTLAGVTGVDFCPTSARFSVTQRR